MTKKRELDFTKYEIIEDFLKNFSSPSTITTYRSLLKTFFRGIGCNPNEYFNRFKTNKEHMDNIRQFARSISDKPPKTFNISISTIKMFLMENDIELPQKFWRELIRRKKGSRAITEDRIPTNKEIKQLIIHGGALEKAMILSLLSSGMRIGELCKIKEKDIDFKHVPVKITIRGEYTKTGNKRYCFISQEAVDSMQEWLKVKQDWLNAAAKKHNFPNNTKSTIDSRVFPFTANTGGKKFVRLCIKAGLTEKDEKTNRLMIHLHTLRKYFRTRMAKPIGIDETEALMGHERFLDAVYRKYTVEQLGEMYLEGEQHVSIFETTPDLSGVQEGLKEKDEQLHKQQEEIQEMKQEMQKLRMDLLEVKFKQAQDLQRKEQNK